MSKKLVWAQRLIALLPLLIAVSAFGADAVIYSDDFESDTIGQAPAGWYDIDAGGTFAASKTTVVAGVDGDSQSCLVGDWNVGATSFTVFDNGFDVNNRQVDIIFSIKGDPGKEGMATYAGQLGMWGGSIDPASTGYPFPQEQTNLYVNGDWTNQVEPDVGKTPTIYGTTGWVTPGPVMKDGVTWNTVKIESVVRNTDFGGNMIGQSRAVISYVDADEVTQTWTSSWQNFQLEGTGLEGFAIYTVKSGAGNEWSIDNMQVIQRETLAESPENFPTPDTMLPGPKGTKGGGITTDGRYLYATAGDGAGGNLYRCDLLTGTWTEMAARPTERIQTELVDDDNNPETPRVPGSVTHNDIYEAHGLSVDANGKIVVMAGDHFDTGNNAYVYDIADDEWAPVVVGNPGKLEPAGTGVTTFEMPVSSEAVGTITYGNIDPGQGGFTEFDTTTNTYLTGQGTGPGMPSGITWGADMAAVGDQIYGLNGMNDGTSGNGQLLVFDTTTGTWSGIDTLADMPVPASGTANAITYVDPKFASLMVLHGDWGLGGLYEIRVEAGGLYAVVEGSDDLYLYDIATDTWTTAADALPFTFASGDDICAGARLWGDANRDGIVNLLDLGLVADNWGDTSTTWADGDFNGDGIINLLDLGIVTDAWGNSLSGLGGVGTVPEPMTMSLLGIGGLALLRRRRK